MIRDSDVAKPAVLTAQSTLDEAIDRFERVLTMFSDTPDHAFAEIAAGLLILAREVKNMKQFLVV